MITLLLLGILASLIGNEIHTGLRNVSRFSVWIAGRIHPQLRETWLAESDHLSVRNKVLLVPGAVFCQMGYLARDPDRLRRAAFGLAAAGGFAGGGAGAMAIVAALLTPSKERFLIGIFSVLGFLTCSSIILAALVATLVAQGRDLGSRARTTLRLAGALLPFGGCAAVVAASVLPLKDIVGTLPRTGVLACGLGILGAALSCSVAIFKVKEVRLAGAVAGFSAALAALGGASIVWSAFSAQGTSGTLIGLAFLVATGGAVVGCAAAVIYVKPHAIAGWARRRG